MAARDVDGLHFRRALRSTLRSRGVAFDVVIVDPGSLVPIVVDTPIQEGPSQAPRAGSLILSVEDQA